MGIVISLLVTFWAGYLIVKKYKPQPVLFVAGLVLMFAAVLIAVAAVVLVLGSESKQKTLEELEEVPES